MKYISFLLIILTIVLISCSDNPTNSSGTVVLVSVDSFYIKNINGIIVPGDPVPDTTSGTQFELKCSISTNDNSDSVSYTRYYFFKYGSSESYGWTYFGRQNNKDFDTTVTFGAKTKISYYPSPVIFFTKRDTVTWVCIKNFRLTKIK